MGLSDKQVWGYSFLGVTLGIMSSLVAPLLFSFFDSEKIHKLIPWFGCFGSGVIISLVINHNIGEVLEEGDLTWDWKLGSVFVFGIITNYIANYSFHTEKTCCLDDKEEECDNNNCQEECNEDKCGSIVERSVSYKETMENKNLEERVTKKSVINKHNVKILALPILLGDSFCNFADGLMTSAAFSGCGLSGGFLMVLAVVLHEIPHEIGDFSILLANGMEFNKAISFNLLSASTAYIGWLVANVSINMIHDTKVAKYFIIYGGGVLMSLVLTMLPKFIKNSSLKIQNLRILTIISGIFLATLIFSFDEFHCHAGHDHHEEEHGNHEEEHDGHHL